MISRSHMMTSPISYCRCRPSVLAKASEKVVCLHLWYHHSGQHRHPLPGLITVTLLSLPYLKGWQTSQCLPSGALELIPPLTPHLTMLWGVHPAFLNWAQHPLSPSCFPYPHPRARCPLAYLQGKKPLRTPDIFQVSGNGMLFIACECLTWLSGAQPTNTFPRAHYVQKQRLPVLEITKTDQE